MKKSKKTENAVTKVIFNESGQAKTLADQKLIEFLAVQKFDQLLAHQYCVRRFLLNHPEYFNALRSIRNRIANVLVDTPLTNENRLYIGRTITAIARSMRMLDSLRIIDLARKGNTKEIRESFESELCSAPSDRMFPIFRYLNGDQILELVNIIRSGALIVEEIHKEVNFLDYYDPFSLTNLVEGKTMLKHYFSAKNRFYAVHHWALDLSSENHWLHTQEAELDDELTGIVCENGCLAKRPPSNVRIYGHD